MEKNKKTENFKEGLEVVLQTAFTSNVKYNEGQSPLCAIIERVWLKTKVFTPLSTMADGILKKIKLLV